MKKTKPRSEYGYYCDICGKKIPYNSKKIKVLRSKTFPGVAKAMAEQWGNLPCTNQKTKKYRVQNKNDSPTA